MNDTMVRAIRLALGALAVSASRVAFAHEEGGPPDPVLAESVAPGIMGIGILLAAAVGTALWFHFRRAAMLRAVRKEIEAAAQGAGGSTQAPDGR